MTTQVEQTLRRVLARWENGSHTLDYLLAREFRQSNLNSTERAQVTELASNWARGRGSAQYLLEKTLSKGPDSLPPALRRLLEAAICRILFEERTPKAIIVSQIIDETKAAYGQKLAGLANAVLRRILSEPPPWPDPERDPVAYLAASTSHPEWILKRWLRRWDFPRVQAQAAWDNQRPVIWLRWNWLRGDKDKTWEAIQNSRLNAQPSPEFEGFFRLEGSFYPAAAQVVEAGDFQVQDPSASLAVRLLNPQPDMEVADLCAAPGGKTTYIAELTANRARITAVDVSASRLKTLADSLSGLDVTNVKTITQDAREFALNPVQEGRFAAVLLDVPCSGFGVLGRRSDLRWRRQPEDLPQLVSLQKELIRAGGRCVKPGGLMVYSTCSIEPQENQEIVSDFLAEFDNFRADDVPPGIPQRFHVGAGEIATSSPQDQIDGIYAARLIRIR